MVVPGGGARLVVLLVLSVLAPDPPPWGARAASPAADDNARELQQVQRQQQQMAAHRYLPQELQNDDEEMAVSDDEAMAGEQHAYDQAGVEKSVTDVQVGCRELRAKRFISDGFCTSIKPIREVVCAGNCLPIMDLPWYAEFVKVWAKSKVREWQCEEDMVKRQSVHLLCRNGQYRTYRIKVVKSCKCKKTHPNHNRTDRKKPRPDESGEGEDATRSKKKKGRRPDKKQRAGESSRQNIPTAPAAATAAAAHVYSGSDGGENILRNATDRSRGGRRKDAVARPPPPRSVAGDGRATNGEGRDSLGGTDRISDAARGRRDAREDDVPLNSWR